MNDVMIPLSVLALDVGISADRLAARFAAETLVDDIGRVCVDRATARALIAERRAAQQAYQERERERRAEALRHPNPTIERVKRIQEAQRRIDIGDDLSKSALATMLQGDLESRLEQAGDRVAEYLGGRDGTLQRHRYTKE